MKRHASLSVAGLCLLVAGCAHSSPDSRGDRTTVDPRSQMDDVVPPQGGDEEDIPTHPHGTLQRAQARDTGLRPGAMIRAHRQREEFLAAMPEVVDVSPSNWESIGPGNIGGRVRDIAIHPTQPNIMYAGTASGGVWKTTDEGATWAQLRDYPTSLTTGSMEMDPNNPDRILVGTGEGGYFDAAEGTSNSAAILGAGIFETVDAGATWNQLPSTATTAFEAVNRIVIDPNDSTIIFAATREGIWRSDNNGVSFVQRTAPATLDIDIDPSDSSKMVAGRRFREPTYSIDGGLTWNRATLLVSPGVPVDGDTIGRTEVAYAESSPNVVYCLASTVVNAVFSTLQIYYSSDGGQTYTLRTVAGNEINSLSNYTSALFVDPTNPDRILYGGQQAFRSADQGVTIFSINGNLHPDHHMFVPHPDFNGTDFLRVFGANDGGVYVRDEPFISSQWFELNNDLRITQFYGGAIHPTETLAVGGAQDNGSMRYDGDPNAWVPNNGGDGGFCAIDPSVPNRVYVESQFLNIRRIENNGATNVAVATGISDTENFIPYYVLDPNNPSRMLAAARNLWRSEDIDTGAPPSWRNIKPSTCISQNNHFIGNDPCNIATITVAEGNSDIIWVGHNNGDVFRTDNGTALNPTWLKVDTPDVPNRWVSRIALDPNDPTRAYLGIMGYESDNVWRTENNGASWTDITANLPDIPVPALATHPLVSGVLLAGTDLGVYWSLDDGASWMTNGDGPGNVSVDEIVFRDDSQFLVVTHGLSMWLGELPLTAADSEDLGGGCGLSGAPVLVAGDPVLGDSIDVDLSGANPDSLGALLLSPGTPTPTDLGSGCFLHIELGNNRLLSALTVDALGEASYGATLMELPELVGEQFTVQAAILATGGPVLGVAEISNALRLTLGL